MSADRAAGAGGVQALFFAYFGFVAIHGSYLSLYLADRGFTVAQIGLLLAVPQALRILAPPVWGYLADRRASARRVLTLSTSLTVLCVAALPFAGAGGLAPTALVLGGIAFCSAAIVPIAEARAAAISAGDAGRYGRIRLWGSVGFIVAVAAIGAILDAVGTATVPAWMLVASVAVLLVAHRIADQPLSARAAAPARRVREIVASPAVLAFFAANFLMLFAHASLYVLFSLYLVRAGYDKGEVGLLWALGVAAEIGLFRVQRRLFDRFGASALFAASIGVASLRFALIGASGGALALILAAQILHGITFGLHHSATMALLHRWFEPGQQARAQALYITLGYGCGGTLGGVVASRLWEFGSPAIAFFGAAAAAGLGFVAAMASARAARRALASR